MFSDEIHGMNLGLVEKVLADQARHRVKKQIPGERITRKPGQRMFEDMICQSPPSSRPFPQGEEESFSVFLKIRASGFAGRSSAKPEMHNN